MKLYFYLPALATLRLRAYIEAGPTNVAPDAEKLGAGELFVRHLSVGFEYVVPDY